MKKVIVFVVFFFSLIGCKNGTKEIVNKSSIKKEINTLLVDWHQAATDANFNNYFDLMDNESVFIGTAAEEIWTKKQFKDFSKPYFDKGKAWSFKTLERSVYVNETGEFVWFDELLDTWMGTCRGSGVVEKIDNTWQIKQYVLSIAIPNEDVQAVISAKKKNDSLFLNKYKK